MFYPNPRGSSNYGEKFLRANINDWGGGDYKRHHDRRRRAGRARHCRPRQARAHRLELRRLHDRLGRSRRPPASRRRWSAPGLTNMWSMYGTNDIPNVLIGYFGGIPNKETLPLYMERSAMTHIDKVDDADADPARRQRRARADRPGPGALSAGSRIAARPPSWCSTRAKDTASPSTTTRRIVCTRIHDVGHALHAGTRKKTTSQ